MASALRVRFIAFLTFVLFALVATQAARAALPAVIDVNTSADEYDIASPNGNCSLREAVQSFNDAADRGGCTHTGLYGISNRINLATTTYTLSRIGIDDDANLTSDLDILVNLTIVGAGAGNTFITGSGGYSGRIVHVLNGANVHLQDLTLKGGNVPNGRAGGGLRSEPGTTTTLDGVVVGLNVADGNAGGILNRGTMTLVDSAVTNNDVLNAFQGGGGIFNDDDATLTLTGSRVLGNTVRNGDGIPDSASGCGIYSDVGSTLTLTNTTVADNEADPTLIAPNYSEGGGVYAEAATVSIFQSTISGNSVKALKAFGGGLALANSVTVISRTLISGNSINTTGFDVGGGGGVYAGGASFLMLDSIVDGNESHVGGSANDGGGGGIELGIGTVINSTISNNRAFGDLQSGLGGGIYMGLGTALVNSTVVNNAADGHGGGIYLEGNADNPAQVRSSTIVGNTSNADNVAGGAGGGVFVDSGSPVFANTVLAGNVEGGIGSHDDCDGTFNGRYLLVQNDSGCTILAGTGNQTDVDAKLGALAANGGPIVGASNATVSATMLTRVPLSGSALVDAGDPNGCTDDNAEILAADQRGFSRSVDGPDGNATATCDIGASEFGAVLDAIFVDDFEP
jgi:CSLREA domain-containing protein